MGIKIFWVILIAGIVGGSFGWLIYYKGTIDKQPLFVKHLNEAPIAEAPQPIMEGWFDKITRFSKDYAYPAEELNVLVDFIDPSQNPVPQRLLINAIDRYRFLCVSEVLRSQNVEFAYSKNYNRVDIIVYLPHDYIKSQNLMQELRYYDVAYTYK